MGTTALTELVKTYVDSDTKERLEATAKREQCSVAYLLRRLIREGLAAAA